MRERPILFNGDMVRAILDGRKTVTRRPVKIDPDSHPDGFDEGLSGWRPFDWHGGAKVACDEFVKAPYDFGDLLYVRESAFVESVEDMLYGPTWVGLRYVADGTSIQPQPLPTRLKVPTVGHKLANGCFKEAARIWLRVTSVSVERVQDITHEDVYREGFSGRDAEGGEEWARSVLGAFLDTWERIYGDSDGWCWVIRFEVVSTAGRPA